MPTYTITGFANSSVGWSANQIDAAGPANVSGDGLTIEVVDDDPIFDDESAGAGQTFDASSQVLGNSFGVVASGQVIQSVYKWTVTNTTTGEVGTGYLLRIYTGTNPSSPGGQDGEYYQVFTIPVHAGDVLSYGSGNYIGQVPYADIYSANTINGTPGDDRGDTALVGTSGDDIINGFGGNDELLGLGGNDVLNGGDGHDALRGAAGNDTLNGGDGDDFLNGGIGDDTIDGGAGWDRATFATGAVAGVTVDLTLQGVAQNTGQGMDTLTNIEHVSGTAFDDTLTGDGGDNWIWGQGGNDVLTGNGGNDLVQAGAPGNLTADGGSGIDTLSVNDNGAGSSGVTVSLALQGGAQATGIGTYTLSGFENLSGSSGNDVLSGDGNNNLLAGDQGNDTLSGGAGDDTLYGDGQIIVDTHGLGGSGPISTIADGGAVDPGFVDGDDTLEGGAGNDTLNGGGGSDTASYEHNGGHVEVFLSNSGFGGADEFDAAGTYLSSDNFVSIENVTGSAFDDFIAGNASDNVLQGLGGNDQILGNGGNDTVIGGDGSDILRGDTATSVGNDVLIGGDGDDHMRGGAGVDSFDGGSDDGGESIYGGIGDRISFFEVAATQGVVADLRTGVISNDGFGNVEAMTGIESLGGDTAFVDTFYGNDGRNTLIGSRGDHLFGFGGDDNISIGSAAIVDGGTGTDTLQVNTLGGWLTPDTNADGIAETMAAATEGWFINLLTGQMFDGYGNFGTVTGIENVDGSELDDTIRGNDGNNVLTGGAGDDFILGMGGDDTVIGGDGNDNLRGDNQLSTGGPFGNDVLIGGAGDDLMRGGPGVDSFDGGSDTGTVNNGFTGYGDRVSFYESAATSGAVADLRTGVISNDGYGNVESMVGVESLGGDTAFADTFYGNDGINFMFADIGDHVYGFGGDDIFQLASAAALVDGGDGIDRLTLTSSGGFLLPDADADGVAEVADAAIAGWIVDLSAGTLIDGYGNSGAITGFEDVDGSELDDTLIGDDNANVLNGLDGNDTLEGRGGDDTLDGGSGADTASYANAVGPVEVDLGAGLTFEYAPDGITVVSTDTLANIENAIGSEFGDALSGDGGNNVLSGLGGDDLMIGGQGDDLLNGGAGFDTAWYAGASGGVTVNLATGTASGADGNDTLTGIENITGSNFDDVLTGDAGANSLTGRTGNDTLDGGAGDDFLRPGAGDDIIIGGSGFDRVSHYGTNIVGGVTVDLRIAGAQNTGQGWDTYIGIEALSGTRYSDTLIGDDSNNWLIAADGNDTLIGNGGNDLLTVADGELGAASGNHSLDGGSGNDTVDLSWISLGTAGATLSLALQGGAQDSGHGLLTLNNIENLSGTTHNDVLTGDGNANTLSGNAGDDVLVGGAGDDSLYGDGAMIADTRAGNGGSGPITFFADVTAFDPSLVDGNDTLEGGLGADQLYGGGGSDTASYEHNAGAVVAQLNTSTAFADEYDAAGNYLDTDILHDIENLTGSAYNDTLIGNSGANVLSGLDGHDFLRGGGGNDTLLGGNGDDFVNGGFGDDIIDGGAGIDRATFATGAVSGVTVDLNIQGVAQNTGQGMDTLIGIENVSGTGFNDTLTGDDGDNWIWGQGGNDVLTGNGGNDLIQAGAPGNLTASGGSGTDTLSINNIDVSGAGLTVSLALQGGAQATGIGSYTLTGFENLSGSAGNDTLTGDGGANVLAGDQGNDTLSGGAGDDTLYGDGQVGIDSHGTGGSGPITTYADVASLGGIDGNDTLEGGAGNDTLEGGGGIDTASYENNSGRVEAFLGNSGFGGADEYAADGVTLLSSDSLHNIENLTGSAFDDFLSGNNGANTLRGLGGNDELRGNAGDDTLDGGDGNDTLRGDNGLNVGNDTLLGGNGNDFLNGGLGNDLIDGGAGYDRATFFTAATAGVTVNLNLQGVAQNTGQGMDTLINIENVSGTAYGDTLIGDNNDNWLWGSPSTDGVNPPTGSNNDTLDGGGGNDLLMVGTGNHSLTGGSGIDAVAFTENGGIPDPSVTISLALQGVAQATGAGSWTLNGIENLSGGTNNDSLTGDGNANVLAGDQGNDTLVGGGGNDTLYGDGRIAIDYAGGPGTSGPIATFADGATGDPTFVDGNDTLEGGLGDDMLNGGGGSDTASYAHASGDVQATIGAGGGGGSSGADGNDTFVSIENLTGGAFNDQLAGNGQANVLDGGAGHDSLRGGGGNDTLLGGSGDDFLNGNVGDDTIDGGDGWDRATFATGAVAGVTVDLTLQGVAQNTGQGMDTLTNIEHVSGTAFDDTLTGDDGDNWIWGQGGNDVLTGNGGNDLVQASAAGNLTASGGSGNDTLSVNDNGAGSPGVTVSLALQGGAQATGIGTYTLSGFENLSGSSGNDTLTGDGNSNVLSGDEGNDTLVGGGGDDTLYGDGQTVTDTHGIGGSGPITTYADVGPLGGVDGNDLLEGGLGNDTINGGGGIDTASYAHASGGVNVNLGGGFANGADGNDTLISIENVIGSEFADTINGDGGANVLNGLGGNDLIQGQGGNDTIYGGDGDDTLRGDAGENSLTVSGDDILYGEGGNDGLRGGLGNDQLYGGSGNDLLRGNGGVDYFDGGSDDGEGFNGIGDRVSFFEARATQGAVADLRTGVISNDGFGNVETMVNIESLGADTAFIDTFYGNDGRNFIGGSKGDNLYGFGGDDLFQTGSAAAVVDGGAGIDLLQLDSSGGWLLPDADADGLAESAAAALVGWTVNLAAGTTLDGYGNAGTVTGIENVNGSALGDTLIGDGNVNQLSGLDGDDTLNGRGGNDTLDGGSGSDTANYANASGSVTVDLTAGTSSGADGSDTLISIENVTGSGFADQLSGNSGDNVLSGGGGNDTLNGRAGNDTLVGGAGTDTASYANASGGVTVSLTAGTASGADGNDTLATIENVTGSAFADTLTGDSNANVLTGGDGDDVLNGRAGNDTLNGGNGSDTASYANATGAVSVNLSTNSATGADGSDTLSSIENAIGSQFADTLRGDDNANVLNGGDGADTLNGGKGDDNLYGGRGNDTITGGQGNDRYVIETSSGADHVTDFASGVDKVVFSGIAGIDDFSDLTLTKVGNNTVITWGTGDSLTLDGVKPNQVSASDFQFAAAASFAAAAQIVSKIALDEPTHPAIADASSSLGDLATFDGGGFDHGVVHVTMDGII